MKMINVFKSLIIILLFFLCFRFNLMADPFDGPSSFGTGVSHSSIVLGDIDNDGDLDLIVTGWNTDVLWYLDKYINNGSGGFSGPTSFGTGVQDSSIALGDIDNDGDLDLIVTGGALGCWLDKYINNGTGDFSGPTSFGTGVKHSSIALGDIDNDGDLDLIVTGLDGSSTRRLDKYTNNGNFSGTTPFGTGVRNSSIVLGDIDNDGDLDLIVTGYDGGTRHLDKYINDGTGDFSGPVNFGTGVWGSSITLGDIDNDGDLDLIVTGEDDGGILHLDKYINYGTGSFSGPSPFGTGVYVSSIALGDIDNDGDLDLIVTGGAPYRLDKYINNGTGDFSGPTSFGTGVKHSSIALGDIDNDGDLDLIVTGLALSGLRFDKYINQEIIQNTPPSLSANFYFIPVGNYWGFKWDLFPDDHTGENLMQYKIAISTNSSGVYDYISASIDYPRGQANIGNVCLSQSEYYQSTIPVSKTVFWKVCGIDTAFLHSDYSPEQTATLKPDLLYPVNINVSDIRPEFLWRKKSVETNIIQISITKADLSEIYIQTNVGTATNYIPVKDLTESTIWWRVISYRQSCQTYFTSAIAGFNIERISPVVDVDKQSGIYYGDLDLNITAYQDNSKTVIDNNALVFVTIYKNDIVDSNLSQTGTAVIKLTGTGKYKLQFYAKDDAGNISDTGYAEYLITNEPEEDTAVYPTVINLNKNNKIKFVSKEKNSNADIKILTLKGVLIKKINGVDLSTGVYEWTIENMDLFPAGQYIVKIGNKKTFFAVIK